MGFLIKSAFWLSLVLLLIPFGGQGADGEAQVGPVDTLIAARAFIGDVAGLCERQPETCETGKAALHTIGVRAREGARIAYGILDEHFGEPATEQTAQQSVDTVIQQFHTGSVPVPALPAQPSQP